MSNYERDLEKAIALSIDNYNSNLYLDLEFKPLKDIIDIPKYNIYKDYIDYSDCIILPKLYLEKITNHQNIYSSHKKINIFNYPVIIDFLGIKFTVLDYQNLTHYAYISDEYFNKLIDFYKSNNDDDLYQINIKGRSEVIISNNNIKKVILEPKNIEFLETKNQLQLFENNIGKLYRLLNKNHLIYSNDKKQLFEIKQIIDFEDNDLDYGYCVDNDLIIDFYIEENKLQEWNNTLAELKKKQIENDRKRSEKLKELKSFKFKNGKICSNSEELPLTKEELRLKRLSKFG
jgi:hypothetical protein